MMQLRPYQRDAVDAVYAHLRARDDNPCVVIPTGGGKTPVMATICRDAVTRWNGRVLILAHVRELLEQAADKLRLIAPDVPVGVYSAGLNRRDIGYAVTIAGIQSVYKRACNLGAFDIVMIDEAHLIPPRGDGMYRRFLAEAHVVNPRMRVVGLTATPFRTTTGMLCAPDNVLNDVCYEVGVKDLINQGYLCNLRTRATTTARVDTSSLHVRAGEYIAGEVEQLMDDDELVEAACAEIIELASDRTAVLIFAAGVEHAAHIQRTLADAHDIECGFVHGETPTAERDTILGRFKAGELKYLVNCNVLTTGFDAPNIDCIALLRPTMSPGLYYQMVGRGFRLNPGKDDCIVLDFGGNVLRHGPVDALRTEFGERGNGTASDAPAKECPQCHELIATGYAHCPQCGYEFPQPERAKHGATATDEGIITGQTTRRVENVVDVTYSVHTKRDDPNAPKSMRVDYMLQFHRLQSEWICVEHMGYARRKAEQWWADHSATGTSVPPITAEEAVELSHDLMIPRTITIEHKTGETFDRIVHYEFDDTPSSGHDHDAQDGDIGESDLAYLLDLDDIPF